MRKSYLIFKRSKQYALTLSDSTAVDYLATDGSAKGQGLTLIYAYLSRTAKNSVFYFSCMRAADLYLYFWSIRQH